MDKGEKLIKKPTYPGGSKAMDAFVKAELKYPEKALANRIEGTVSMVIDVDGNGHVTGGRIKKSIGHGCDEEALRIGHLLKFSTSAKRKNRRITFHRTINIHFRLPKTELVDNTPEVQKTAPEIAEEVPKSAAAMQVVYTFVPKKKVTKKP